MLKTLKKVFTFVLVSRLRVEELKNDREWEDFVQTIPEATFYHTIKWKNIIEKSFRFVPAYLTIKDREEIVGVCPGFVTAPSRFRIYSSLPHSDYGGSLFKSAYSARGASFLLNFLTKYCSAMKISYAKLCFLCNVPKQFSNVPFTRIDRSKGIPETDLKTTSSEFIWKALPRIVRRKIRHIEKEGFKFEEINSKSGLKEFYSLYRSNMRYIRASAYPYEFFENLWDTLPSEELKGWLLTGNRILGGSLSFVYRQTLYSTFIGINRKTTSNQHNLSVVPYFIWNRIKWAEENGLRYVSMGSTPSDPTHFYYRQKMQFGAKFFQQEIALIPFNYNAKALLKIREKAIPAWKNIRNLLPTNVKTLLEDRLFQL